MYYRAVVSGIAILHGMGCACIGSGMGRSRAGAVRGVCPHPPCQWGNWSYASAPDESSTFTTSSHQPSHHCHLWHGRGSRMAGYPDTAYIGDSFYRCRVARIVPIIALSTGQRSKILLSLRGILVLLFALITLFPTGKDMPQGAFRLSNTTSTVSLSTEPHRRLILEYAGTKRARPVGRQRMMRTSNLSSAWSKRGFLLRTP